jgi:uncharacterized protein (DUF1330 family)
VYVVATLQFTDVARYRQYQARFPDVFNGSGGSVLAADEQPRALSGGSVDKVVIMRFGSEEEAEAFLGSPEYLEISKDRDAGAQTTSWMVRAL